MDAAARFVEHVLQGAEDARTACRTVVDFLAAHEGLLPSAYLEQGGRLRCQAQRGYGQVLDGFPPTAGIIGRTYRTGLASVLEDAGADRDYLAAAGSVQAEICIPVLIGGRPVGVLNVESTNAISREVIGDIEHCAAVLGARLAVVGHGGPSSAAERLVRHATILNGLVERKQAVTHALATAAADTLGMESAGLLMANEAGFELANAVGPLTPALEALSGADRLAIAQWVLAGTSSFTVGEPGGATFPGHEAMRRAGAASICAVLVGSQIAPRGALLVADRRLRVPTSAEIELLELLAAHGESCLQVANALDDLRRQAASDPLTGLGHHATFHAALSATRQARDRVGRLAVCIADVDGFKAVNDRRGHQAGDDLLRSVAQALSDALRPGEGIYRIGGDEFAALIPAVEEADAPLHAARLAAAVARRGVTLSLGMALELPDERDSDLLARADRALYSVKARGRNGYEVDHAKAS